MGKSIIKPKVTYTTLWGVQESDKKVSGEITWSIPASEFTFLIIRLKTNVDHFTEYLWNTKGQQTWFYTIEGGTLSSSFVWSGYVNGLGASVNSTTNNNNWRAGIYEVVGVKLN